MTNQDEFNELQLTTKRVYGFEQQLTTGQAGEERVAKFFRERGFEVQAATSTEDQSKGIDLWVRSPKNDRWWSLEVKADAKADKTGNAFIEIVSNDVKETLGWVFTCCAERICYFLPGSGAILLLKPARIRQSIETWQRTYKTTSVRNKGYDTIGLLVPMVELESLSTRIFGINPHNSPATESDLRASKCRCGHGRNAHDETGCLRCPIQRCHRFRMTDLPGSTE